MNIHTIVPALLRLNILMLMTLISACGSRAPVTRPEGLGTTSVSFSSVNNGFKLVATGGYFRFANLGDDKIRYHPAPELTFGATGQAISATDDSLTLQPRLQVPGFLRATFSMCSDGVASYREESGRRVIIARVSLVYFPQADKLKSLENGFFEATAEAGEPVTLAPDGLGESCQ